MDYLLDVFFNSKTNDKEVTPKAKAGFEMPGHQDHYFKYWKWDWRQSEGPGWREVGEQRLPVVPKEAALGKLITRVWNRDAYATEVRNAEIRIQVLDAGGNPQNVNTIFSAYKYKDPDKGVTLVPFQAGDPQDYRICLTDVPGGKESNAESGDQVMRSWDIAELYFNAQPADYRIRLSLFVRFGPDHIHRIFFLDPEMDPGFTVVIL